MEEAKYGCCQGQNHKAIEKRIGGLFSGLFFPGAKELANQDIAALRQPDRDLGYQQHDLAGIIDAGDSPAANKMAGYQKIRHAVQRLHQIHDHKRKRILYQGLPHPAYSQVKRLFLHAFHRLPSILILCNRKIKQIWDRA